jgi:nucleotide-binding universal stress UspA family protein
MSAFNKILLCTDYSRDANKALTFAIRLASHVNAKLSILHVIEPDSSLSNEDIENNNKELEAEFFQGSDVEHDYLSRSGEIEDMIEKTIWEHDIDIVVMGIKGLMGEREMIKGSITAHLIDKPFAAVLGIPGTTTTSCMDKMCVAVDKVKSVDKKGFEVIRALSNACGSTVEVFHVQNKNEPSAGDNVDQQLSEFFGDHYGGYSEIPGTDVMSITENYLKENEIDMLILFHSSASDQAHHRSMAKSWVFKANIPLLILPGH